MAKVVHDDVVEHILIGLDVEDLVRFKTVCKSWHSLITSPRFINRHLNRSYHNDPQYKRIVLGYEPSFHHNGDTILVGSSNGLVCIFSFIRSKLLVGNPLTREVRQLRLPPWIGSSLSWGFGYDSSRDDYKVIVGDWKGENQTCVRVLSLKSSVWRVIGVVKYTFISKVGILCNGALHWITEDQNNKKLVISYDLSKEKLKKFPQPDDARYECTSNSYLGIIKEFMCIFRRSPWYLVDIWLMKKYNVKQSWVRLEPDYVRKYDTIRDLRMPKACILPKSSLHDDKSWLYITLEPHDLHWSYIPAPIFVKSLVSPHVNGSSNNKRSAKLIKEGPSASGPNA